MTDLHHLSAHRLAALYAKKKLSPVEATKAALTRIAAWEPKLNAMYLVQAEQALASARASEKRWAKGKTLSPIDGVPVTLKENLATKGDPMPVGSASNPLTPKAEDSPVAARMRESGAVILGKTTMPDFGMLSSGQSSIHGLSRNPWNPDCNTSGSSSGAGAAAAAGYGPLHVGTDIGGSVRLPAAHSGLFGLKPSLGRIPTHPPYMGRVAGPMTREVRDSALLMNALARPDWRDFMSLPESDVDYAKALNKLKLKGLRIGWLPKAGVGLDPEPEISQAAAQCVKTLAEEGASVVEMKPFMTPDMLEGMERFFEARSNADIAPLSDEAKAKVLPYIIEWATWRAGGFSGADVINAYSQVMAMREAAVKATAPFDFVVSPTTPVVSYPAEAFSPTNDPRRALAHIGFTVAYNMSEQPASSINWSFSKTGMPLGVQIIGKRFDDLGVLRLSAAIESFRPGQRAWPEP